MSESFLNDRVTLHCGDCREVIEQLEENSIDSCVTDPPYHLTSIVQRFGAENAQPPKFKTGAYGGGFKEENGGTGAAFARMSRGFMGKQWDGGDIAFRPELWAQVYRVLKPGAHLLAFGGTRTYHRMACAIEDAGFEIRDCVQWLYGSGFPKSHDVSKGIDRAAGAERTEVIGSKLGRPGMAKDGSNQSYDSSNLYGNGGLLQSDVYAPSTPAARQWEGWGTALKPACELIVLARKPLSESTVAANVLRWGTGAINVDGCRVATDEKLQLGKTGLAVKFFTEGKAPEIEKQQNALGRWPANVIHDGSEEVVGAFPESTSGALTPEHQTRAGYSSPSPCHHGGSTRGGSGTYEANSGSAARFFYTSKADTDDRLGSKHPTVKPLDLMQYLVRVITPKGGTVLDPFAGTGTTGEAAFREGMSAVLIEREAEYQDDIRRRMKLIMSGPDERARESMKQRMNGKPVDNGPLFDFYDADRDFSESINDCYRDVRERVAKGGPGWGGWPE